MILYTHSVLLKTKESVMTIVLKHSVVAAVGKICTCRFLGLHSPAKSAKTFSPKILHAKFELKSAKNIGNFRQPKFDDISSTTEII